MSALTLLVALQVSNPAPRVTLDTSGLMTRSEAQSSIAALEAEIAAERASIPQPASATPSPEVVGGQTGQVARYAREDHTHPRITRGGQCVLSSGAGICTVSWSTPLAAGSVPNIVITPVNPTTQPVVCNLIAVPTVTSASVRCWFARPLPATLTLLSSLVLYDVFGAPASGLTVQVTAIPVSQ